MDGVIAIARGRNEYLPGALCEAYPKVQSHWMSWADECIAAGVDGMEVLMSSHSTWTDHPNICGFNEPVAEEYRRRHSVNPDVEPYEPELIGAIRGEFFDQFLQALRARLSAAGKRMQLNLDVESYRPGATLGKRRSLPGNMTINWRSWVRSGLGRRSYRECVRLAGQTYAQPPLGTGDAARDRDRGSPNPLPAAGDGGTRPSSTRRLFGGGLSRRCRGRIHDVRDRHTAGAPQALSARRAPTVPTGSDRDPP